MRQIVGRNPASQAQAADMAPFIAVHCGETMSKRNEVIHIHADAPAKPVQGAPCNGCGVCCLAEPCPLGMVLSRKRQGACVALRWSAEDHQYRCGATQGPWGFLARRWISAGTGCDSSLQALHPLNDNGGHD